MRPNAVAVINGKGGSGKTSLTAQIAGLAAQSGWRTLIVELDAQANINRDLGTMPRSDGGRGLYRAIGEGMPLDPIRQVRPNLDLIPAGPDTQRVYDAFNSLERGIPGYLRLDDALQTIGGEYHLIVMDCPPLVESAQMAALSASSFVLLPTTTDLAALDGLSSVLDRAANVRKLYNPRLQVLGVVLMFVATGAVNVRANAVEELEKRAMGMLKLYDPPIRVARAAADACRVHGLLVHELQMASRRQSAKLADEMGFAWWAKLSPEDRKTIRKAKLPDAAGLAEDYRLVTEAVLTDMRATWEYAPTEVVA